MRSLEALLVCLLSLAALLVGAGCLPAPTPVTHVEAVVSEDAGVALESALLTSGTTSSRLSDEEADLVLFYGGEHKGSMETCGCPKRPRGSLARMQGYIDAAREKTPESPDLLLHTGYFLEDAIGLGGSLREDVPLQNEWMARGLEAQQWDALNLSYNDLPGWRALAPSAGSLPVVSANIVANDANTDWPRWRKVSRGDLTIGIVGVSNAGVSFVATPEFETQPLVKAAGPVLEAAAAETDLLILLAYQAPGEAKTLAEAHPEIDIVIDAYKHRESTPPFVVGNAIWVKSDYETQRLGELRLWLDEGRVLRALDRKIDLDPDVADSPELRRIMLDGRTAIAEKQRALFGQ